MEWQLSLTMLVPTTVAVGGWIAAHWLSARRDRNNRRRELVTAHLLEAYRKLEKATMPRVPEETWADMESAIADIQLLGSPTQVQLALDFSEAMAKADIAKTHGLLISLRKSLRRELRLKELPEKIVHLRFNSVSPEENIKRLKSGKRVIEPTPTAGTNLPSSTDAGAHETEGSRQGTR